MFASRACRKSVMIGKSLTKTQMTQVSRGGAALTPELIFSCCGTWGPLINLG
jgi:DNA mismatch repair ATPase MutL